MSKKIDKCKICGRKTNQWFNIQFAKTPICEPCESSIVLQAIVSKYSLEDKQK